MLAGDLCAVLDVGHVAGVAVLGGWLIQRSFQYHQSQLSSTINLTKGGPNAMFGLLVEHMLDKGEVQLLPTGTARLRDGGTLSIEDEDGDLEARLIFIEGLRSAPTPVWVDDKGKKSRLSAPQYIDYIMTFVQKTINDETVFPTKHGECLNSLDIPE